MVIFFFNDTATTEIYTLSLHDALPISCPRQAQVPGGLGVRDGRVRHRHQPGGHRRAAARGGRGMTPDSAVPAEAFPDDDAAADRAAEAFRAGFGGEPEGVWAAPGRVNVIGEHTDYNGGFVLPIALPHTTRAAVGRRGDGRLRLASLQHPDDAEELALSDLAPRTPRGWGAYPAGVVAEVRDAVAAAGGLDVLVDGDVPSGAGLSSSAALECAVALGLR